MEMFSRWCAYMKRANNGIGPEPEFLASMQYVDISNAASYFYEHEREYWDVTQDFPALTPPFERAWMEFKYPDFTRDGDGIQHRLPQGIYSGAIVDCYEIEAEKYAAAIEQDIAWQRLRKFVSSAGVSVEDPPDHGRRILQAVENERCARWYSLFVLYRAVGWHVVPIQAHAYYYDPEGRVIPELIMIINLYRGLQGIGNIGAIILPYFYAISLLHCKNVELENAEIHRKIKRRLGKLGMPDVVFKNLVIMPVTKRQQRETAVSSTAKQRLHICRGHFKDYRQGSGLFGKFRGLYWWPQHLRGDAHQGRVFKDYLVHGEKV